MNDLGKEVSKFSDDLYILSFDPMRPGCDYRNVNKYMTYLGRALYPARVIAIPVGMSLSRCSPTIISELKDYMYNLYCSFGETGTEVNNDVVRSFEE